MIKAEILTPSVLLHPILGRVDLEDLDNTFIDTDVEEIKVSKLISESQVIKHV